MASHCAARADSSLAPRQPIQMGDKISRRLESIQRMLLRIPVYPSASRMIGEPQHAVRRERDPVSVAYPYASWPLVIACI